MKCSKCQVNKDFVNFPSKGKICLLCKKKWQAEYYFKNKSKLKKKKLAYRKNNKDLISEYSKKYYEKNILSLKEKGLKRFSNLESKLVHLLNECERRAAKKRLPFDLDLAFLQELLVKQNHECALTKIPFNLEPHKEFRVRPFTLSVDRINNKLGYTRNNIRLVCAAVNLALNQFGEQVFDYICNAYVNAK